MCSYNVFFANYGEHKGDNVWSVCIVNDERLQWVFDENDTEFGIE